VWLLILQNVASALFSAAAINTGGSRALQRSDVAAARSAEAQTSVHGDQQQHWSCVSAEGLRSAHSLSQRSQPAEARQVGHKSAHRFSPPGTMSAFFLSLIVMFS